MSRFYDKQAIPMTRRDRARFTIHWFTHGIKPTQPNKKETDHVDA